MLSTELRLFCILKLGYLCFLFFILKPDYVSILKNWAICFALYKWAIFILYCRSGLSLFCVVEVDIFVLFSL